MPVWDPYIRGTAFIGFDEVAARAGGDPLTLLAEAGHDPGVLGDPDRLVSFRRLVWLLDLAVRETGDQSFGLRWTASMPEHFPVVGPMTMLAIFASTVGEWMELSRRYWNYHCNAFTMDPVELECGKLIALRYNSRSLVIPRRQAIEHAMGNICRIAPVVSGHRDLRAHVVRFQHARPDDTSLHEQIFDCPLEFEQSCNEIVFARDMLDVRTNGSLRLLRPMLDYFVKFRMRGMPSTARTLADEVALRLSAMLGGGSCTIDAVAMSMNMSGKTLQRQLAREGASFADVLENVREYTACKMLIESDAPASRIAGLLGYSAQPPFTLAFKRWTGETPHAFRRRMQRERFGAGARPDPPPLAVPVSRPESRSSKS